MSIYFIIMIMKYQKDHFTLINEGMIYGRRQNQRIERSKRSDTVRPRQDARNHAFKRKRVGTGDFCAFDKLHRGIGKSVQGINGLSARSQLDRNGGCIRSFRSGCSTDLCSCAALADQVSFFGQSPPIESFIHLKPLQSQRFFSLCENGFSRKRIAFFLASGCLYAIIKLGHNTSAVDTRDNA